MAENTNVPTVTLQAGSASIEMPQLGFGVWQVENDGASAAVQEALKVGYRSIDTARIAENFDVLDFELTEDDLHAISDLDDKDGRIGSHPNDLN